MFNALIKELRLSVNFTYIEMIKMLAYVRSRRYKPNEKIINGGDACKKLYFINKGLARVYYETPEKDIILDLLTEGDFYTDFVAFTSEKYTEYDVQAIDDVELFYISYENLQTLFQKNVKCLRLGRLQTDASFTQLLAFQNASRQKNLEEKYLLYKKMRPKVFDRAPLKYIAGMLNVDPATLSRLRKKLSEQEIIATLEA